MFLFGSAEAKEIEAGLYGIGWLYKAVRRTGLYFNQHIRQKLAFPSKTLRVIFTRSSGYF